MKIILIAIFVALLGIAGIFYFVLKNKSTEVSYKKPYTSILNQILITKKEAYIFKCHPDIINIKGNVLKDDSTLSYGEQLLFKVPLGSKLSFSKAIHYTKGVSGNTYSLLIGKVWMEEFKKELEFEYEWGEYHFLCIEQPCKYWTFSQAVWEESADSTKYFINK